MSKKLGKFLVFVLFFGMILYTGYAETDLKKETIYFVTTYLNVFEIYLYRINLLIGLIIMLIQVPFYNFDIAIRIKNLKVFLLKYYIIRIVLITLLIQAIYSLVCFCCGYSNPIDAFNIMIFMNLFVFILSCIIFYLVNYFKFKKVTIALAIMLVCNMVFLIFGHSFLADKNINLLRILNIYEYVIILFGSIYILLKSEKLEILKNE